MCLMAFKCGKSDEFAGKSLEMKIQVYIIEDFKSR